MGKSIYTRYKERLIEIGGKSKCLYLSRLTKNSSYDLCRLLEGRKQKCDDFLHFLFSEKETSFPLVEKKDYEVLYLTSLLSDEIKRKNVIGEEQPTRKKVKASQDKPLDAEISALKTIKREMEDIEKETGRYELYIGYPFVYGSFSQNGKKTPIKAPLLLFPVRLEFGADGTVDILHYDSQKIRINPALIYAYGQARRLSFDSLELEFDDFSDFRNVSDVLRYLASFHIAIRPFSSPELQPFSRFKDSDSTSLFLHSTAVLGRFPIANSIYTDYSELEKRKLTNEAIDELLTPRAFKAKQLRIKRMRIVRKKAAQIHMPSYAVRAMDFAQSQVVKKANESGNIVIFGPPGTGKSQTIVNIITDALVKNKRVLVVSQKKAALDVVFNRLGDLKSKAMYIGDESKDKAQFYKRAAEAHNAAMAQSVQTDWIQKEYRELESKIENECQSLKEIETIMNERRPFGISLSEMYRASAIIAKGTSEYAVYQRLLTYPEILSLGYKELKDALFVIGSNDLAKSYYNFMTDKENNPVINFLRPNLDIPTLGDVIGQLNALQKSRKGYFNTSKYPYYRQVLAFYNDIDEVKKVKAVAKLTSKMAGKGVSCEDVLTAFAETKNAMAKYLTEYECLNRILTPDGYLTVIDNILRGNTSYVKFVLEALDNYLALENFVKLLDSLGENELSILNFAYAESRNYKNFLEILDQILPLCIYHVLLQYEEEYRERFATTVNFGNISRRISDMQARQLVLNAKLVESANILAYQKLFSESKDSQDYLHQISKQQKFWPIRQTMETYGHYLLTLFPCFLLSPENVSSVLPLVKNLFDIVIFDEASQVFIENTIPTIYRGKNVVVAGDEKQLRPSATFVRRYLGTDEDVRDVSMQAALEVDSLLDLAVSRYDRASLTYHYRSRYAELIAFSNRAFYNSDLQIAPNISKNHDTPPILFNKVDGQWLDRKNVKEATAVVNEVKNILQSRQNGESVGVITFNAEQQATIAELLEKEAQKDPAFRRLFTAEMHRSENGEDISLFVKNLENVQGDERDIIIFSVGYAKNEDGKVYSNFGSLSAEGGENRLNVAVTRAKSRVIVYTSIDPEELKVENAKFRGPKLLKKYLSYARAVSHGDEKSVKTILDGLSEEKAPTPVSSAYAPEVYLKNQLEKLGYCVDLCLGDKNNRLSLAVYDKDLDRYLIGVELDSDAFSASSSVLERDVSKPRFMESRGWRVIRIWSRDVWASPKRVIRSIVQAAEQTKKQYQTKK